MTQLDADGGAPAEFLIDYLPFTGADGGTALSATLVEAKAKLKRCKEDALKKKATKAADVELMSARSTLCGEREAK